jgi:aspartyl-tRNA(Asn)/glutamyl-tRNA(Gln) amidotransferase subunit C
MKLEKKDIDKLAHLARLEFSDQEKETVKKDMDKILGFVAKINELDLEKTEPLIYMTEERNVLRTDEAQELITKDEALKNAPDRDTDFFRVPKVLKRDGEE